MERLPETDVKPQTIRRILTKANVHDQTSNNYKEPHNDLVKCAISKIPDRCNDDDSHQVAACILYHSEAELAEIRQLFREKLKHSSIQNTNSHITCHPPILTEVDWNKQTLQVLQTGGSIFEKPYAKNNMGRQLTMSVLKPPL